MLAQGQQPPQVEPHEQGFAKGSSATVQIVDQTISHIDMNEVFDYAPEARCILSPSFHIQQASLKLLGLWKLAALDCVGQHLGSVMRRNGYIDGDKAESRLQKALHRAARKRSVQVLHSYDIHGRHGSQTSSSLSTSASAKRPGARSRNPWILRLAPVFRGDQLLSIIVEWLADASADQQQSPAPTARTSFSLGKNSRRRYLQEICPSFPSHNGNPRSELSMDEAFSLLVQSIHEYAIILLDVNGNIATWNDGARLHKGYAAEEVLGRHFSIFYDAEEVAEGKPQQALRDCLRDGRVEVEGWRYRKDGTRFWANVTITTVYKNGIHVGFGKVTRNLTECREAELRVVAAYEESAKLKSEFLANMSHEIRTPLHGMLTACSLLQASAQPALTAEQRETARIIDESGQVLLAVINDILDYSKLASGHFSIHTDVVGITSIVAAVVRNAQAAAQPGVRVQLAVASDLPRALQGDPQRYRQVLENIVGNATKFTERGSIRVSAAVESEDDDECVIRTEVSDTGIGIIPATTTTTTLTTATTLSAGNDPFEPFARLDDSSGGDRSSRNRVPGVGLGLAISKSIVELMGGQIGFRANDASPHGGSIFWFTTRFRRIKSLAQLRRASSEQHVWWRRTPNLWKTSAKSASPSSPAAAPGGLDRKPTTASDSSLSSCSVVSYTEEERVFSSGPDLSSAECTPASSPSAQSETLSPPAEPVEKPDPTAIGEESIRQELRESLRKCEIDLSPRKREAEEEDLTAAAAAAEPPAVVFPVQMDLEEAMACLRARAPTKRVLVAEDNMINQRVLVGMLKLLGFDPGRLVMAGNGEEAVSRIRQEEDGFFDLVLMDINMPVMDGYHATAQIRDAGCAVPIVAMTAYALQGDQEQCLAHGMDDYISKPVGKKKLVHTLLAWLPE